MTDQLQKYKSYRDIVGRLLIFSGLWPSPNSTLLYRLVPFVHFVACGITNCAMINFCLKNFADLDVFLKGLSLAFGYSTILQKTVCMILYRNRLIELHATLNGAFTDDLEDSKLRTILLSPLGTFRSMSFVIIFMTYIVLSSYCLTPLIVIGIQYFRHVSTIRYILPYQTVYPWTITSWRYPAHYIFDVYVALSIGAFGTSIDTLFGYYVFQMCGQLRTLSHRVTSVRSNEDYGRVIRECVVKHQILIKCRNHLERIYGPIVICMLIVSAIIMCALIYQASHLSVGKAEVVLTYLTMKSMQTLFYGVCGTILTTETEMFRRAVYASDWPGSGEKSLMTDVLVMITYNPLPMKACGLSTISVEMFTAVCNTALSYFFMLRTLEGDRSD